MCVFNSFQPVGSAVIKLYRLATVPCVLYATLITTSFPIGLPAFSPAGKFNGRNAHTHLVVGAEQPLCCSYLKWERSSKGLKWLGQVLYRHC